MNKIERVTSVLAGRKPDRPPFCCWYHFPPSCIAGPPAIDAHLRHVETYDLDFLKIMDDNRYPRTATRSGFIADARDLDRLTVLRGDEDRFGQQLEVIGGLARRFRGKLLMATTVFHAWGTLRQMTAPDAGVHGPPTLDRGADPRDAAMTRFLLESPQALARALDVIAESSANFVRHCLQAGADGIFLSVRDDWVDTADNGMETYDRLVRPTDLRILAGAAQGTFNMLHVCGKAVRFERFIEYPVHLINWADRYAGPTIAEVVARTTPVKPGTPALCAGLDNLGTLAHGTPQECAAQAVDAIQQAGSRPIMIAPGCTFDPALVPTENLLAVRQMLETASP